MTRSLPWVVLAAMAACVSTDSIREEFCAARPTVCSSDGGPPPPGDGGQTDGGGDAGGGDGGSGGPTCSANPSIAWFNIADSAYSLAVGDFNGDRMPDFALSQADGGAVWVFLNGGDGAHFLPGGVFDSRLTSAGAIAVGDLNLDTRMDIVVANPVGGQVSVLYNLGDGGFQAVVLDAGTPSSLIYGLAVLGMELDLRPDISVSGVDTVNGSFLNILHNFPDGGFDLVTHSLNGSVSAGSLRVGELATATPPGAVIVDTSQNALDVLLFQAGQYVESSFPTAEPYPPASALQVALGDLNGDGAQDAVIAAPLGQGVSVHLNDGSGNLPRHGTFPVSAGGLPVCVAVGDLNGDGILDVVVGNQGAPVDLLLGLGNGDLGPPIALAGNMAGAAKVTAVAVADFNADGVPDVVYLGGINGAGFVTVVLSPCLYTPLPQTLPCAALGNPCAPNCCSGGGCFKSVCQ